MTGRTLADLWARHMLDHGLAREAVIAEFLRETTLDRIKRVSRIRPGGPGERLFDPGAPAAGALWMRAEIVAAVLTALSYGHIEEDDLRAEVDRAIELALAARGRR